MGKKVLSVVLINIFMRKITRDASSTVIGSLIILIYILWSNEQKFTNLEIFKKNIKRYRLEKIYTFIHFKV